MLECVGMRGKAFRLKVSQPMPGNGNSGIEVRTPGNKIYGNVTGLNAAGTAGLTIAGDYTQLSTGTLVIVLGGAGPDGPFSKLVVTGAATLAGTLEVTLAEGYTPQAGDTFGVLTYGSHGGMFQTISVPQLDGLEFDATYDASGLTLTVVQTSSP
jgi:hypothetical protein